MTATTTDVLPWVLARVRVASAERISPTFVRLELAAPELADVGLPDESDGRWWDQRFKLVVPDPDTGGLTSVEGAEASWLGTWLDRPVGERGHMRTYTLRELRGSGADTLLVVDIAVHDGDSGPGAQWAERAVVGDAAVVLLPRRGQPFGGIEFAPPAGSTLLLAGDETAVPAICAVLEQLGDDARGVAFMEVPDAGDIQDVRHPVGVDVTWLVRTGEHGAALATAVTAHLDTVDVTSLDLREETVGGAEDIWETPTYSSTGEEVGDAAAEAELYAWIAGESGVVTALRRHLVRECGIDRSQVAFMGYWRRGVSMKS